MKQVFIDADILVALGRLRDKNHRQAEKIYRELKKKAVVFFISNTSLYETVTVISQRISHQKAKEFLKRVRRALNIVYIDQNLESRARLIFNKQRSKNVSFFDCLNMAILKEMGLGEIFSFDEDYKRNGILRIGIDEEL